MQKPIFPYVFTGFSRFGASGSRLKSAEKPSWLRQAFWTPFRDGFRTILGSQNGAKNGPELDFLGLRKSNVLQSHATHRDPTGGNGGQRFGTRNLVLHLIRSYLSIYLSIDLLLVALISWCVLRGLVLRAPFWDGFRTILSPKTERTTVRNRTRGSAAVCGHTRGFATALKTHGTRRTADDANGGRTFGTTNLVLQLIRSYLLICSSSP